MLIVLLAIIGSQINAGTAYWVCYGLYILFRVADIVRKIKEE